MRGRGVFYFKLKVYIFNYTPCIRRSEKCFWAVTKEMFGVLENEAREEVAFEKLNSL